MQNSNLLHIVIVFPYLSQDHLSLFHSSGEHSTTKFQPSTILSTTIQQTHWNLNAVMSLFERRILSYRCTRWCSVRNLNGLGFRCKTVYFLLHFIKHKGLWSSLVFWKWSPDKIKWTPENVRAMSHCTKMEMNICTRQINWLSKIQFLPFQRTFPALLASNQSRGPLYTEGPHLTRILGLEKNRITKNLR